MDGLKVFVTLIKNGCLKTNMINLIIQINQNGIVDFGDNLFW